jgi:CheY-like chemotaxis protein
MQVSCAWGGDKVDELDRYLVGGLQRKMRSSFDGLFHQGWMGQNRGTTEKGLGRPMAKKPISVLVVDDEPVLRELVAFILVDRGFEVWEAESGDAAFELLQGRNFDVVVSDVRMPNGSGIDLLLRINQMERRRPHVFLVSGYSEISLEEARGLGAIDLLNKPVDYDSLCLAISQCRHLP